MEVRNNAFTSIEQVTGQYLSNRTKDTPRVNSGISFDEMLRERFKQNETEGVKFSKHADERLKQRNITLSSEQLSRLNEATRKADAKGIKESLIVLDNLSFIVNTGNNMVITAMEQSEETDNIYTNIDGAVII